MSRAAVVAAWLLLAALLPAPVAHAQAVRAWLDRDHIGLDETATLNIEVVGDAAGAPDYAPLRRDFRLSGHSSSRRLELVNGRSRVRTLYGVALQPLHEGVLRLPPLAVGGGSTPPLSLTVTAPSAAPGRAGDPVFIESEADADAPWVQQSVGYVVRLYVGVPLVSGQLEQPEPDGAALQRVGDDVRYTREVGGRSYTVIERHYLLLPERSGPLEIPGARFEGRGISGFFDEFLGQGDAALAATGAGKRLRVRPVPDAAPQPWLPLHGLSLRWTTAPAAARAGDATTVTVEAVADGATADQLPELVLPPVAGARVFAAPVQVDERFVDGRPRATARRSFSIVPSRAGRLHVEGPRLEWWDVDAGEARTTSLPALALEVAAGQASAPTPRGGAAPAEPSGPAPALADRGWRIPGILGPVRPWAFATVLFALAWLLTLAWGLGRRRARADAAPVAAAASTARPAPDLRRALRTGDLDDIADALCAGAVPPVDGLDAVPGRLADAGQRAAVQALQAARWGGGDPGLAREALRAAFARGPAWRSAPAPDAGPLPPLYP